MSVIVFDERVRRRLTDIVRERSRRLEAAVVECIQRGQRVEMVRHHLDAGNISQRAELIVAGEVVATVDLSDLAPERLMRDSGKPPA